MTKHLLHDPRRRDFVKKGILAAGALGTLPTLGSIGQFLMPGSPVVSVVKIRDDNVPYAVEKAIDLLGGMAEVARGKSKVMLKPNLVADDPRCTTKPVVVRTVAQLLLKEGKEVSIGEGSAAASGINADEKGVYFTRNPEKLEQLQQAVFDKLGYSTLAKALGVPLVNLHCGPMIEVEVPGAKAFGKLTMHRALQDTDLLCSIPMMKTHVLATVTLGMKNLIGLYPGSAYCTVRSCVHAQADDAGSPGIAYEILDMVRANKLGLTVIDGSVAMEGDGPSNGNLVKMDLIIAGTNPLATDMVAASIMGFSPDEVPTFNVAHQLGMLPLALEDIEVRGERTADVARAFQKPNIVPFRAIRDFWGAKEV